MSGQLTRNLLPLGVYVWGLVGLIGCDVLITKFYESDDIATWAGVRSLLAILGVLCLFGLDQVLVRSPRSSARLLRLLALQVPALALVWGGFCVWIGVSQSWIVTSFIGLGAAGSLVFFQYFRSHGHRLKSQLSQQGWKIVILLCVAVLIVSGITVPLDGLVAAVLCLLVAVSAALAFRSPPSHMHVQDPEKTRALYKIGVRFMVSSLLLSLSIYAEQLVVNALGSSDQAANYFTHATYFLFPISLANGYFAFLIGPWVRDNHDRFVSILRAHRVKIFAGVIAYVVAVQVVGYWGWFLIAPQNRAPDFTLQLLFAVTCFARTLYTLPSAYMGVFGKPRQHDWLIGGQTFALAGAVAIFAALFLNGFVGILYAVAFASMINWLARVLVGAQVSRTIIRSAQS